MALTKRKLKVGIEFRVEDPRQGVGHSTLALLHGLGQLMQDEQEYVLIVWDKHIEFFRPYVSGHCSLVGVSSPAPSLKSFCKAKLRHISLLQQVYHQLTPVVSRLPTSDGTAEAIGCDLVHFPSQIGYTTALPTIYQPWDLQHRHYPQFFSLQDYRTRETQYRGFCERARFVCVQTEWTKRDVVTQYDVDPDKIVVIRWGTAFEAYQQPSAETTEQVCWDLSLPKTFFLYPAICWPHKNHAVILRALALLKERSDELPQVVFTGKPTKYQKEVETLARELQVADAVRFLGFTSSDQIQVLFHLATALLFPSHFEGLGMPILEAFQAGLPVISSNASVLPEVAKDAALLFDPNSPKQLADRMEGLLHSPPLREELATRGGKVQGGVTMNDTAWEFFKLYSRT